MRISPSPQMLAYLQDVGALSAPGAVLAVTPTSPPTRAAALATPTPARALAVPTPSPARAAAIAPPMPTVVAPPTPPRRARRAIPIFVAAALPVVSAVAWGVFHFLG